MHYTTFVRASHGVDIARYESLVLSSNCFPWKERRKVVSYPVEGEEMCKASLAIKCTNDLYREHGRGPPSSPLDILTEYFWSHVKSGIGDWG